MSAVECQRDLFGWVERVRSREHAAARAGGGFLLQRDIVRPAGTRCRGCRGRLITDTEGQLRAAFLRCPTRVPGRVYVAPACGGSSDLAAAFGLVGGPGAVGLPDPVDDLRTETRAVGR